MAPVCAKQRPGAISAAATPDGTCAVAYVAEANAATVDLGRFSGRVMARWFDPSAGGLKSVEDSPFPNTGSRSFNPPGPNSAGDGDEATRSVYWSLAELPPSQRGEVKLVAMPVDLGDQRLEFKAGAYQFLSVISDNRWSLT